MNTPMRVILIALLAVSMGACSKKVKEVSPPAVVATPTETVAPVVIDDGRYDASDLDSDACLRQRVVYFDFDKAEVKAEAQAVLACHGKYLKDLPGARMTLEGHADERGSREYNLSLGEHRALAVRAYLISLGVAGDRIQTRSFGEEQPLDPGHGDAAWLANRRGEFSLYRK